MVVWLRLLLETQRKLQSQAGPRNPVKVCYWSNINKKKVTWGFVQTLLNISQRIFTLTLTKLNVNFSSKNSQTALSSTIKRPKTLMKTIVYNGFFGTVFKSLRFHLSDTRIGASSQRRVFKRLHFWNRFRKSLFSSSVFILGRRLQHNICNTSFFCLSCVLWVVFSFSCCLWVPFSRKRKLQVQASYSDSLLLKFH